MIHSLVHDNIPFLTALGIASIAFVGVALIVERLAHRVSSASRHTMIFAALLAPPLLAAGATLFPRPEVVPAATPGGTVFTQLGAVQAASGPSEVACTLVAVWLIGVVVSLARSARNALHWRGVAHYADAKEGYFVSHECDEPMVIGIVKPAIVLPAGDYMTSLTLAELETVFAHEQAHVARRDNLVALFAQLAFAFFWFDPLHRMARRRLVILRERACDEAVLERGCDADSYLAALARSCEVAFRSSAVACMSRLQLRERMESIMTYVPRRRSPAWIIRAAVFGAIAIAAIAFAALAPTPSLTAAEVTVPPAAAAADDFSFDVTAMRGKNMAYMVSIRSSVFTGVTEFASAPATRTVTATSGDRTWKWVINVNADGSGIVNLEVTEGTTIVATGARIVGAPIAARRVDDTMKPPKAITRVEPIYPEEAKQNRVFGVVILELLIKEDGTVGDARVLKPLPYGLDQAALDAVRQWRFEPATIDGKPVPVAFNITINFKLDSEPKS